MFTESGSGIIAFLCFFCFFIKTDCQFTETPAADITKCSGNDVNLRWNYLPTNLVTIQWSYQTIELMSQFQTMTPVHSNNYNDSIVEFVADAEILLKDLKTSSSGSYSCTITYFSGTVVNSTSLVVYDSFNSGLTCQYKDKAIDCTKPDASVSLNATDEQGKEINMKKPTTSGNYTICMYGGAIICRGSFDICTTVEVNIEESTTTVYPDTSSFSSLETSTSLESLVTNDLENITNPIIDNSKASSILVIIIIVVIAPCIFVFMLTFAVIGTMRIRKGRQKQGTKSETFQSTSDIELSDNGLNKRYTKM